MAGGFLLRSIRRPTAAEPRYDRRVTSPISILTLIVAANAIAACALVVRRRWTGYAPVAALLVWCTTHALGRSAVQAAFLNPARAALGPDAPYYGAALPAYFAEVALRSTWPFAILAACIVVFLRRRPWWLVAAWSVTSLALCVAYPELRREPQALVEAGIASVCWLASVGVAWYGHRRLRRDPPECYVPMALILSAQLAVILLVQWSGRPEQDWSIARLIQGVVYAALLVYQSVNLWKPMSHD
jgi:hypothetical protein